LLASCAVAPTPSSESGSKEYFSEKEYGVSASPRLVASGETVPKGGGRYQVGKPYKVKGKTYRPKEDPNYSAVGLASWYGGAFHGRKTANGEIYDMGELTAAHPTLPLPSYVRVTNLANDRSVVVRINDRGPFARGRVIDVSATVAEMLDFRQAGTTKVKVQYVGPARMDGHDRQMLFASYQGPNDFGHDTLFASKVTRTPKNIVLASLNKPRKGSNPTRSDRSMDLFGAQRVDAPAITAPAFVPTTFTRDDPLGPLILRAGFVSSYAPADQASEAQAATEILAERGRSLSLVQLGTFGEKANADRVAARFSEFGKVTTRDATSAGRTLHLVQVLVDRSIVTPDSVVAAAAAAGLSDAFVLSR
jgi:rare lipoprotein A